MSNFKTFFVGARDQKGRLSFLSKEIEIEKFFELLIPEENSQRYICQDFGWLINELYRLHCKLNDEVIRKKYEAMYNYWRDARTYCSRDIQLYKSESLTKNANDLIVELRVIIEDYKQENKFMDSCSMYVDTLLCFIHSKVSLEPESFKKDELLQECCSFIFGKTKEKLKQIIWDSNDFLKYLMFTKDDDVLQGFLCLLKDNMSLDEYKLNFLNTIINQNRQGRNHGYQQGEISIEMQCKNYSDNYQKAVDLCGLLYKIHAIKDFLSTAKDNDIEWTLEDMNALPSVLDKIEGK